MEDWFTKKQEKEVNELIGQLQNKMITLVHTNARARARNQELQDEHYKDNQMAIMKQSMEDALHKLNNGFGLTDVEVQKTLYWQRQHDTEVHKNPDGYHGASGGGFEWVFYPTALGTTCDCICSSCKRNAIKDFGQNYWEVLKEKGAIFPVIDWSDDF